MSGEVMTPPEAERPIVISQAELLHVPGVPLAEYRNACWFADVWAEHCRPGMHLRGIYYRMIGLGNVRMAAGVRPHEGRGRPAADPVLDAQCLPFENSAFCWRWLQKCALAARHWQLVDARDFEEHRSPKPRIHSTARDTPVPDVVLPAVWPEDSFPTPSVIGYDYSSSDQPLTVEVWCEKSTMDDVLAPLCETLHVNYQPLTGMFSVTRAVEMLCRLKKSTIVLYVSDLDGAGCNMPVAFAEALEHYAPIYTPGVEIKLKQIALTEAQVLAYHLPRNVIDKQDETPYNKRFRAEHPLGPCELDALEAIHPGALARIVREAVRPYIDKTFNLRLLQAQDEAERVVKATWQEHTAEVRQELSRIEDAMRDIEDRRDAELAPHEAVIATIRERFDEELDPLQAELEEFRQRVLTEPFDVDLPERPQPAIAVSDDDWLFAGKP